MSYKEITATTILTIVMVIISDTTAQMEDHPRKLRIPSSLLGKGHKKAGWGLCQGLRKPLACLSFGLGTCVAGLIVSQLLSKAGDVAEEAESYPLDHGFVR